MVPSDKHLYEFEPFVLDASSRLLLKDGVTVRLTPKAFDTLFLLVRRAQQVIEKDQLLKEVWPDTFVEEGSLSRNIHELRKSLGDDSAEPRYIETIPKRGYRFVAPVKISVVRGEPLPHSGMETGTTVIEKHTYARVITDESEGTDPEALSRVVDVEPLRPAVVADATGKQTWRKATIGLVALTLVAAAIGAFLYFRPTNESRADVTRGKSFVVRLTHNSAMDGAPVFSRDGSKIAFWSNRDGKKEIYVMDTDGSNVKRLTNNIADEDNPKWSPDGRRIVFDSDRDGNTEIYVMDADGNNQTRLTNNNAFDSVTTWSPDGNMVAFASNRDSSNPYNLDIYVMNADGSNVRRIVNDPEYDAEPKWSPDGQKLLFVTGRNNIFEVYETKLDGTGQRKMNADTNKADGSPAWSLDGSNIAFVRHVEGKDQIFVMDAHGNNLKQVTNNPSNNTAPSWSPDGSKLVFCTDRDGNWEIYVTSIDGELAQLTDDPADDVMPDWSPDGSKIAFASNRAGKQQIYVLNSDGSGLAQLTNSAADDTEPSWSPDGKRIAFTSSRDGNKEVYVMNADGSNQTRVTSHPRNDSFPKWSGDGRILFTSNRDGDSGIYVTDDAGRNTIRLITMTAGQAASSPDGTKVSFVAMGLEKIAGYFQFQIFVVDVGSSNVKMLTSSSDSTFGPCWLPNGKSIAFTIDMAGVKSNIFQIDADGTDVKRLTAGPKLDARPTFSPDGSKVAFQSNRDGDFEIYVLNLK